MQVDRKIRIAFIKFAGMTIGGSELWLQKIAVNLPKDIFEIDFYYCDDTPYIGGEHVITKTSNERITYLQNNGVNVIKFTVGAKNIRTLTHDWINTDFWDKFDEKRYDIIQTVKAGPKEYPFYKIKKPVVEIVGLANRPDTSKNIAWSFHSSNWQRAQWVRLGGSIQKSSVLTAPVEKPQTDENYRLELHIPDTDLVAGFHQRNDNLIASDIPLYAFAELQKEYPNESKHWHFIIKNGGSLYREQAKDLKLKNIHFLGQTPDSTSISKFLNTLDVFAHGRKDGETFGAVFVEAMLHGKPCLSHYSLTGANAQFETMGPAGVFAYSVDEYKKYLHRFFTDTNYRNNLASKAKPHAEKYYSMERCLEELTQVYFSIVEKNSKKIIVTQKTIPYGYSDMGFLYAGNMNKPENIAYTVLVGGIPRAFNVAIVKSLLPHTKNFFDIGAGTGIYCWLAADYYTKNNVVGNVHIFEERSDYVDNLTTTMCLNNWEDICTIHTIGLSSFSDNEKIYASGIDSIATGLTNNTIDFIKIDFNRSELGILKGGMSSIEKHTPILFMETKGKQQDESLAWLFNNNYRIFTCSNNIVKEIFPRQKNPVGASYLCLQRGKHDRLVPIVQEAVNTYISSNFLFGKINKQLIRKVFTKIIPPYITTEKVATYIRRRLHLLK